MDSKDLVKAIFGKDDSPVKLTDDKSISFIAASFVFTKERNNVKIVTEKGVQIPVTISDSLDTQVYFQLLSTLTGKTLSFENGVLVSMESGAKPKTEKVVKEKATTRSCETSMLLNR